MVKQYNYFYLRGLSDKAEEESYQYFDKHIRPLPKRDDGTFDTANSIFADSDVDAFRHAYVSGVFTQELGEKIADRLGRWNELLPVASYSNKNNPKALNMDLWNNHVGREYGKKFKDKKELMKALHRALKNGELIIDLNDPRKYTGQKGNTVSKSKPVIVLLENEKGRNDVFYDVIKKQVYSRDEFVAKINAGEYPGYTVKTINGIETPVSKPDGRGTNNLG